CLGLLQRSVRVWMLEAGLLDTALINSYNSFWLALLAKRSFFLTVKENSLTDNTFTSTVCHNTSFQSASDLLLQNHFQLHILHFLPWLRRRPLQ
ncbi:hypothetical protein, partial [Segatella copri]|uniref:hypothetical protein n=1 Tax=Segatella copri TaxID=165179 RepID=UPI001D174D54